MEICDKNGTTAEAEGHCGCGWERRELCVKFCKCVCHDYDKGGLIPWIDRRRIAFVLMLNADAFAIYPRCSCIDKESDKCGQRLLVHTHGCECVCHEYMALIDSWAIATAAAGGHYASAERMSAPDYDYISLGVAPMAPRYLGQQNTEFDGRLDLIEWSSQYDVSITLNGAEFTSRCPVTDQPDFATIMVQYTPQKSIVETKSFKLWLQTFREKKEFNEKLMYEIAMAFWLQVNPHDLFVEMTFNQRGGISVTANLQMPQIIATEDIPFEIL